MGRGSHSTIRVVVEVEDGARVGKGTKNLLVVMSSGLLVILLG